MTTLCQRIGAIGLALAALAGAGVEPAMAQAPSPVPSRTGWAALADDPTHTLTIWHGSTVVATMPIAMGNRKHPTPNGTYHVLEKNRSIVMDSSTFGVPVSSPEGYRTLVEYATRLSWSGIFIHAAPWSLVYQGRTNVSHGCIEMSTDNAKSVYDELPIGTPVVVRGTVGGRYTPGS